MWARGTWAAVVEEGLLARLLTCRPAFAECDFVVLACESPFPPVLPPVFPVSPSSASLRRVPERAAQSGAYLCRQACLLVISRVITAQVV